MSNRERYTDDYINAVVCDPGSHSFRIGMAHYGEPTVEMVASVGIPASALDPGVRLDGRLNYSTSARYDVDVTSLSVPREGVELVNYMNERMIDDLDLFEKVLDYAFANYVRSDMRNHPVLFTEPPSNLASNRVELAELMFEKYQVPSMYMLPDAALAAFAVNGFHGTAVIVDSGATHTSVVPVHEGFVIGDCIQQNPLGGNFISDLCKRFLNRNNIDIIPHYMIEQTRSVKAKENPIWTMKTTLPRVTESWHSSMCDFVVDDFKHSVLQISKRPFDGKITSTRPTSHYTFPNGYNQEIGKERFEIPESLFGPNPYSFGSPLSLSHMVTTSIRMCDEYLRSTLYDNIIIIGGNSLLPGYHERLFKDICVYKPFEASLRLRTPKHSIDRQYCAWLGGSMIATDETAENLWFSSYEYHEYGKSYIGYKCPNK